MRKLGFTYNACGPFTNNKERIQIFKKNPGDSGYIYQKGLDKVCFRYDIAYGDFKDLPRRTASDKALRDKVFDIAKYLKYDRYQSDLDSMVYNFLTRSLVVVIIHVVLLKVKLCQTIIYLNNYTNQLSEKSES